MYGELLPTTHSLIGYSYVPGSLLIHYRKSFGFYSNIRREGNEQTCEIRKKQFEDECVRVTQSGTNSLSCFREHVHMEYL